MVLCFAIKDMVNVENIALKDFIKTFPSYKIKNVRKLSDILSKSSTYTIRKLQHQHHQAGLKPHIEKNVDNSLSLLHDNVIR